MVSTRPSSRGFALRRVLPPRPFSSAQLRQSIGWKAARTSLSFLYHAGGNCRINDLIAGA